MKLLAIVAALAAFATAAPQVQDAVALAASVPLSVRRDNVNCDDCSDTYSFCMTTSISWVLEDNDTKIKWQNDHCSWICAKRVCQMHEDCRNECGWDKCEYGDFQDGQPAVPAGVRPESPYETNRNS